MYYFTNQKNKGTLLILFSTLMFGSYGVWSRLIGDSFGSFYQGWTRGLILTIILFPILYYTKQIIPIKKADWGWLSIFLIATSLTQAPLFYAFNHMDIGTATLLFFVGMLLTMYVVGIFFLKEKLTPVKIISFIIACVGLYVTFSFSVAAFTFLAALMAVLNGIASGSEVSFSKKLSDRYSPLYLSWMSWVIIFATNAIISIGTGEVQHAISFDIAWVYQIAYTLVSVFGFWSIMQGLKYAEASIGGLLGLLEILFSIGFGILIFHESLSTKVIIGGILIVCAAALPYLRELKARKSTL